MKGKIYQERWGKNDKGNISKYHYMLFEVLRAVTTTVTVLRKLATCSGGKNYKHFRENCSFSVLRKGRDTFIRQQILHVLASKISRISLA